MEGGPVWVRAPGIQMQVSLVQVGWRKDGLVYRKIWSAGLGDSGGDRAPVSSHSWEPRHTSTACFYKHFVHPSVRCVAFSWGHAEYWAEGDTVTCARGPPEPRKELG